MKNLFKSLVAGTALVLVSSASAGTLYWQAVAESAEQNFDTAFLIVSDKEGNVINSSLADADAIEGSSPSRTAVTQAHLDGYESDAYLFYVEMCNYNSGSDSYDVVATGYKYGYGDLVSQGYVATGAVTSIAAQAAAEAGNLGSAVPEPSSGLLLVIGGAMLALRRRRQK